MKSIFLFCIFMSFGTQAKTATIEDLAVGVDQACAISNGSVQCWGESSKITTDVPTGLMNPRSLVVTGIFACVIDDVGVKCWGDNRFGSLNVPVDLNNPTQLFSSTAGICALTDSGLKCWGDLDDATGAHIPANLINPHMISLNFWSHSCAVTDIGPKCWGSSNFYGENDVPPSLQRVEELSAAASHACSISNGEVQCWGEYSPKQLGSPTLTNPRGLTSKGYDSCVIADEGVACWGVGSELITSFKHPRKIVIGHYGRYAIADDGVKCHYDNSVWGKKPAVCFEIPANLSW